MEWTGEILVEVERQGESPDQCKLGDPRLGCDIPTGTRVGPSTATARVGRPAHARPSSVAAARVVPQPGLLHQRRGADHRSPRVHSHVALDYLIGAIE